MRPEVDFQEGVIKKRPPFTVQQSQWGLWRPKLKTANHDSTMIQIWEWQTFRFLKIHIKSNVTKRNFNRCPASDRMLQSQEQHRKATLHVCQQTSDTSLSLVSCLGPLHIPSSPIPLLVLFKAGHARLPAWDWEILLASLVLGDRMEEWSVILRSPSCLLHLTF